MTSQPQGEKPKCPKHGTELLPNGICVQCEREMDNSISHQPATPSADEESATPPLAGEWRYNNGVLCCGTLRIAVESIDTNPSDEFKAELFDWIVERLNGRELASLQSARERCKECGCELSYCGAQDSDGEPSLDCPVCKLRDQLKLGYIERNDLRSQLQAATERAEEAEQVSREWRTILSEERQVILALEAQVGELRRALELAAALPTHQLADPELLKVALAATDALAIEQPDLTLIEEVREASNRMFEAVDMRRDPDALQERADFLIKRGWTPIPFTPIGAPEGVVAKITHPYQKWQKHGASNRITEQALKIELREDTDKLRAVLARLNPRKD